MDQNGCFSGVNRRIGSHFTWFEGVVEEVKDPKGLGRVKVRILGDHTQDKTEIPTELLPWATVAMPVSSASTNGMGDAPVGLVPGTWVFGYYRDDTDKQQPRILATLPGVPQVVADKETGFNDPYGVYPYTNTKSAGQGEASPNNVVGRSDNNSLAKGSEIQKTTISQDGNSIIDTKGFGGGAKSLNLGSLSQGISGKSAIKGTGEQKENFDGHAVHVISKKEVQKGMPSCCETWDEPETVRDPVYPYNKVWESQHDPNKNGANWGHVEEWDSTPNKERYFRWHKSSHNSFEIFPDGREVHKIYGDNFELDLAAKCLRVDGDYRITVKGNVDEHICGDKWTYIEGNQVTIVDKNIIEVSHGSKTTHTDKGINRKSKESITDVSEKDINRVAKSSINDAGNQVHYLGSSEAAIGVGTIPSPNVGTVEPNKEYKYTPYENTELSAKGENKGYKEKTGKLYNKINQWNQSINGSFNTFTKWASSTIYNVGGKEHHTGHNYMMALDVASKTTTGMLDAASTIRGNVVACMIINAAQPQSGCYSGPFLRPGGGGSGSSPASPSSSSANISSNAKQDTVDYKTTKTQPKQAKLEDPFKKEQVDAKKSATGGGMLSNKLKIGGF